MIGDRLSMLLLVLTMVLGAVAIWQWRSAAVPSAPVAPAAEQAAPLAQTSVPEPFVVPSLDALTQTLERPLFSPTRRPPPPEEVATTPTPTPVPTAPLTPLAVELSAVILEPDRQFALFRQAAQGALLRAEVGQSVDGWLVSEIRGDGVSLKRGTEKQDLVLRTFKAPVHAPTPRRTLARAQQPQNAAGTGNQAAPREAEARRARRPRRGPRRRAIQRQRRSATQQQ